MISPAVLAMITYLSPSAGVEIPVQQKAHGSFQMKLQKLRFRFKEHREGVAAARQLTGDVDTPCLGKHKLRISQQLQQ